MQERDRRFSSLQMPRLNKKPSPIPNNTDNEPSLIKFDDEPDILTSGCQNIRVYFYLECINQTSADAIPKNTQQQST
jgi:hypothetical protein